MLFVVSYDMGQGWVLLVVSDDEGQGGCCNLCLMMKARVTVVCCV